MRRGFKAAQGLVRWWRMFFAATFLIVIWASAFGSSWILKQVDELSMSAVAVVVGSGGGGTPRVRGLCWPMACLAAGRGMAV
ncbi:MAG: hypothetical protein QXP01_04820 [Candidatus Hadarchaeum sp.]